LPHAARRRPEEFMAAFHQQLAPAVNRFKPEFDHPLGRLRRRHGDPLGRLELTDVTIVI